MAGLIFAWLAVKTGSLWPTLFGHALANGLPFIAERVLNLKIPGFTC
ncbi:MAG: CPBP family intramembrane metalloprotease [Firmicutes bacterium]|nr:CPBP family intramembrane metalloprotease [Bacillota bacterium]